MIAFLMTAETACDIFDDFLMKEAISEEERVAIITKYVETGKVQAVSGSTTKEQLIAELSKHYSVLDVKRNKPNVG